MSLALSPAGVATVFPFHLAIDRHLVLVAVSPRLAELWRGVVVGARFDDVVEIERPHLALNFSVLAAHTKLMFVLRHRLGASFALRGSLLPEVGPTLVFVGAPLVDSVSGLVDAGLTMADFPMHDVQLDTLLQAHGKDAALSDAQRLASELRTKTRQLLARTADLQGELLRTERLASLGRLVAGVAHEINTPIGVARMAGSLVREQVDAISKALNDGTLTLAELKRGLADAGHASDMLDANLRRAADLVSNFKQVAVDQTTQIRRLVRPVQYFREVVGSLAPILRRASVAVEVVGDERIVLETFAGALSQVLTVLIENAVVHGYGSQAGNVRIAISADRDGVEWTCQDWGRGMAEDVRARCFEPFFTTRRGDGGTGLGLHIVHNLITDLFCGKIAVESTPGKGATFTVRMPTMQGGS